MINVSKIRKRIHPTLLILIFLFVALGTCGFIKIIKDKQGPSEHQLAITFNANVTPDEQNFVQSHLSDLTTSDANGSLIVNAETVKYKYNPKDNSSLVYDIYVPVVDFYSGTLSISASTADHCKRPQSTTNTTETDSKSSETSNCAFIPLKDLKPSKRLVAIDNSYFFDHFSKGAEFRVLHFSYTADGNDSNATDSDLVKQSINTLKDNTPAKIASLKDKTFSFTQTGVTALSRAMLKNLNDSSRGNGDGAYFAKNVKKFLSKKDITHTSNEVSFAKNCKVNNDSTTLCADWRMLSAITAIGTDIIELTGNHNNDYGTENNIATLEKYASLGIATVGGGANATAAATPIRITDDSSNKSSDEATDFNIVSSKKPIDITFLAYNKSTSTVANGQLASDKHPGANGYDEKRAKSDINSAKKRGDFVVVDVQFFECYCYPKNKAAFPECDKPISGQEDFFRHLIDLGADMVVGTQAHQPQTFEIYKGKPIYYGLGNLFFDQTYWPDTKNSLVLTHYFVDGKYTQTRISPTSYQETHQPTFMDNSTAESYLGRLINSSPEGK